MRGWRVWAVVVLLLGVMSAEMAASARRDSVSWDEGDHLFAGYMSLATGDYGLNPEHPPLAKMVAALPLRALPLRVPALEGRFFKDEAYFDGRALLFHNAPYSADTLLFRARMAASVFALGLALLVFLAGREMFGTGAGLLAMGLVVLEPNLLTHGRFVTTDAAISCLFFATVYLLYRYARRRSLGRLLAVGGAAGLALAAKHSAIVLLPVVVLLLAGETLAVFRARRRAGASRFQRAETQRAAVRALGTALGALAAITVVSVGVLWAFYGFRYAARPGSLRLDPTLPQYVQSLKPLEARGILLFARFHLLPESWLYGLADVRRVANWMPSYLFGKVYAHGVWAYFPCVLLIKLTLGTLGLLLLAGWAAASSQTRGKTGSRETWYLLLPAGVYLLVAMSSQLNLGVRHVLPVLPFLLVFAAGGAHRLTQHDRRWAYAVGMLFAAHAASSLRAFPNYLPYSNEAWGGSSQTWRYLSDSNADWGQQLKQVSVYLQANGIHDCWFGYFVAPFVQPADYGIPCRLLPTFDTDGELELEVPPVVSGVVVMSSADVNGFEYGTRVRNPYQPLVGRRPDAVIDDGVFVYRGSFALPDAAAMAPTERSKQAFKRGDVAGALGQAQAAVALSPASFDALLQLGEVQARSGNRAQAEAAFGQALARVDEMEPSAQLLWRPRLQQLLAGSGR